MFFFVTISLGFVFDLLLEHRDLFIFYFLLQVKFVQDPLTFIELALLNGVLLLLTLDLLVHLSNLALDDFDLFYLYCSLVLQLSFDLRLVGFDRLDSRIVRVDFSFGTVYHDSNEELAVTLFAHRAPKFVQFVLYFTKWEESFLLGTVFASPVTAESTHSHFLFCL